MTAAAKIASAEGEQTYSVNMTTKLVKCLLGTEPTDCCFKFNDKELKAHSKLLSAFSSVFAAMFNSSWRTNSNSLNIVDTTSN